MASDKLPSKEEVSQDTSRRDPLLLMLEEFAARNENTPQGKKLRKEFESRISEFNASLDYARSGQKPYLTNTALGTIAGWTSPDFPHPSTIPIIPTARGDSDAAELANTVRHEDIHRQRLLANAAKRTQPDIFGARYTHGQIGDPEWSVVRSLMDKMRAQKTYALPPEAYGNFEEFIAYLGGIEGQLQKGTPLTATKEFKNMSQREKNLFFGETSDPYGGVWEGQIPPTAGKFFDELLGNIPSKLSKDVKEGTAKAADVQQWLQEQIGKVIGTR